MVQEARKLGTQLHLHSSCILPIKFRQRRLNCYQRADDCVCCRVGNTNFIHAYLDYFHVGGHRRRVHHRAALALAVQSGTLAGGCGAAGSNSCGGARKILSSRADPVLHFGTSHCEARQAGPRRCDPAGCPVALGIRKRGRSGYNHRSPYLALFGGGSTLETNPAGWVGSRRYGAVAAGGLGAGAATPFDHRMGHKHAIQVLEESSTLVCTRTGGLR